MKRLAVVYAESKPKMEAMIAELRSWTRRFDLECRFVGTREEGADVSGAEMLIVLGGDGTFLHAARLGLPEQIPILGVDLGRLGFLSEVAFHELPAAFERLTTGAYRIEERAMLDVRAYREGEALGEFTALNDAVVSKGAFARLVELATYVDGGYLTTYAADGLIVSTPTGSTAYALSAGGPLLTPELPVFVLAPICPHSLSARPMVISDAREVRVSVEGPSGLEMLLTADGQVGLALQTGDQVLFRKSSHRARLVKIDEIDFFTRLQNKLGWGSVRRPL